MRPRTLILASMLIPGFLSSLATGNAGTLDFGKTTAEITVEPGAEITSITFPFHNNTGEPIEITKQSSSCGCISAKLKADKKIYQPGEKGEVEATFTVGDFKGTVNKQVVIWQKGESETATSIILTAKITIPELLAVTPRTLTWKAGAPPSPASYRITVNHGEPIRITGAVVTSDNFSTELKAVRDGWEYELIVTPLDTSKTGLGIVRITSDSSIPRRRHTQAFAIVR